MGSGIRIRRRRRRALMDIIEYLDDFDRPRQSPELGPRTLEMLRLTLGRVDQAMSRLSDPPHFSDWPADCPPDHAEALRRLHGAQYVLAAMLGILPGPTPGPRRNRGHAAGSAGTAPREIYPRRFSP